MAITYQNPVTSFDFADPFVLRAEGAYYAYGTAATGDERMFPVLRSDDLVHWTRLGGALEPLPGTQAPGYWAPEVAGRDGTYFLFYSATNSASEEHHRIRVALSDHPAGPFRDTGRILLPDLGFTIDASPFFDPMSGSWFLFFATDFEHDEPHGTGVAVVQLSDDLLSAVTSPVTVARAQGDWQIYQTERNYKGRVWPKWFTVEGPNVMVHDGRYYCFYSGGAWFGENYGVGVAVADHPLGPWRNEGSRMGPAVLKGIPGSVIGPGHNSHVLGPDGKTLFMIYHAWDAAKTARRMFIDPILWTPDGPRVDGPSVTRRTI